MTAIRYVVPSLRTNLVSELVTGTCIGTLIEDEPPDLLSHITAHRQGNAMKNISDRKAGDHLFEDQTPNGTEVARLDLYLHMLNEAAKHSLRSSSCMARRAAKRVSPDLLVNNLHGQDRDAENTFTIV